MRANRWIAALLSLLLAVGMLASCAGGAENTGENSDTETTEKKEIDTSEVVVEDVDDHVGKMDALLEELAPAPATDFETEATEGGVNIKRYVGTQSTCRVPERIGEAAVVGILDGAFAQNTVLTALYIPDSVQFLGEEILMQCTSLKALRTPLLGKDAAAKQYLGYLFGATEYRDNPLMIPHTLEYLQLGGNAETLPDFALFDCNDLICVAFPSSLRKIGDFAFYNCKLLEQIRGLEQIVSLGEYAMAHCSSFRELTFGTALTSIGISALEGCAGLQALTLPFVGGSATENTYLSYVFGAAAPDFSKGYYPHGLARVTLLEGCTSLGNYAFYECESLKELLLPEGLLTVGVRAFAGCTALWSITLPNSLTTLREAAFNGCTALLQIQFGSALRTVGINCFYGCTALRAIALPQALTALPASCFADCHSLVNVDLGGVLTVGKQAFRNCHAVKTVTAKDGISLEVGNDTLSSVLYPADGN